MNKEHVEVHIIRDDKDNRIIMPTERWPFLSRLSIAIGVLAKTDILLDFDKLHIADFRFKRKGEP